MAATPVIDVRNPTEIADGFLEGAFLVDWQNPNFAEEIVKLDKASNYVIYCRSGNRAGLAIDRMKELGFTGNLSNAGGLEDAAASTGLPIVL